MSNHETGIQIRRPRPKGVFKMLLNSLLDFTVPAVANYQGSISDLTDPKKIIAVYVGHATVFINFYGTTILTDPMFANRIGLIIKRKIEPGPKLEELPMLDVVLISHAHLDHLNRPSLRRLANQTKTLIIPKNCTDLVRDLGFRHIVEQHWSQILQLATLQLTTFQPQHWGTRLPWERFQRGYNSYLISKQGINILFAGDTGYAKTFEEIGQKHPIDIALFPITAYNPPEFRAMHMSPEDAARAFIEMKARYLIPIHWGVFRLSLEPMDEPPRLIKEIMRQKGMSEKLKLLSPGELFTLPPIDT